MFHSIIRNHSIAIVLVALTTSFTLADHHESPTHQNSAKEKDPLGEYFIPPELIMQRGQEVGLGEQTRKNIRAEVLSTQQALPALQAQMLEEMHKLKALLDSKSDDESAVLAQFDRVLGQELKVKRLHIKLLYRIRQQLSDSQFMQLMAMKVDTMTKQQETKQRLQGKVARVQQAVQKRMKAGKPPYKVAELMKSFKLLINRNQVDAAESVLDKALEKLGEE